MIYLDKLFKNFESNKTFFIISPWTRWDVQHMLQNWELTPATQTYCIFHTFHS